MAVMVVRWVLSVVPALLVLGVMVMLLVSVDAGDVCANLTV
jgi:hypothetical protein